MSPAYHLSAQTTPTVFTLKKEYLGPEGPGNWEAVAGPNFIQYYPLKYQITVDIADGQTIHDLEITDGLPGNLQFAGHVSVTILGARSCPCADCQQLTGFPVVIADAFNVNPGWNPHRNAVRTHHRASNAG